MTCTGQSDETLVALTLAGNLQAYEKLVLRHQRNVIASAYSVLQDHFAAEDAAQDAFVKAWRKLNLLKCPEKYGSWVCRISANCARNLLASSRKYVDMDIEEFESAEIPMEHDLAESMIAREEHRILQSIMEKLPERTRMVLCLHYFDGLPIKVIAEKMLISSGTVKWQLHEGRNRLRKELARMTEKENRTWNNDKKEDTTSQERERNLLSARVMSAIKEIQLWRLRDNRDGFQERYQERLEDIMANLESLPESQEKCHILADILMEVWNWMPGRQDDALWARIREAAVKGRNESVMESIMAIEDGYQTGGDMISFMRNTQIPFLEEHGFVQSLGREWFWLGREYFFSGDQERGYSAYERVLSILKPKDVYYAFALAARQLEEIRQERFEDTDLNRSALRASGEEYRFIEGVPRRWLAPSYDSGNCWAPGGYLLHVFQRASGCDRYFYVPGLKVGEAYTGTDGSTLTFAGENLTVETLCGTFDGCQCWITMESFGNCRNYYKDGVGLIRQELIDGTGYVALKSCQIKGGEGLIPFCTGNRWTYELVSQVTNARGEEDIRVTYADEERAVLGYYSYGERPELNA